jgi:fatty-acyl-CoA synthase
MSDSRGHDSRSFRSSFPDVTDPGFRSAAWRVGVPRGTEQIETIHPTLLHALASAAKLGEKTGITLILDDEEAPEEIRSFRRLYAEVKEVALELATRGVLRGDRVLIVLPTSYEFVISFFAVQRLGAIPVPSYPPAALERVETGLERLAHIGNHARVAWCLTTRVLSAVIGDLALRVKTLRRIVAVDKLLDGGSEPEHDSRPSVSLPTLLAPRPEDPALIQYTSGSTGNPKGVLLTHANVTANIHAVGQALQVSRTDSVASWLPLYHDMGLVGGLLFATYWRIRLVLMSPTAFLMRPPRWLWAIHNHKITLSQAPNFAYSLCVKRVRAADRVGLDLSSWRLALNGAEPVNQKSVQDFLSSFAPHGFRPETMYPVYGLAETTVAATFPRPGDPLRFESVDRAELARGRVVYAEGEGATTVTCVGSAVPGHDVIVADENGEELADGEVGHILIRGPSVMKGYYKDPDATAKVLRHGWLWTGDLGYTKDKHLFVTGRAKDLIILRGANYYAEDLERVAEAVDGVRHGGVVAFAVYDDDAARDVVVAVCETKIQTEAEERVMAEKMIEAVGQACGVTIDEVVFVAPGTIPKTSSGKRQRSLTRERYLTDTLVPHRTGKLQLVNVFARSAAGMLALIGRRMTTRRHEPP